MPLTETSAFKDGSISTNDLADDAVTTDKIADGAVTVNRIANNAVTTVKLGTGAVVASKIGIGQVTNARIADDAITTAKIADGAVTQAKINSAVIFTPVGTVITYAGSSAPTGYLICNGTAISRTTYAALFAIIGTTYGAGDGSSTFNLPNLQEKFIVGSSSNTGYNLADTGGAADVILTATQMPNHAHYVNLTTNNAGNHNHTYAAFGGGTSGTVPALRFDGGGAVNSNTSTHNGHNHSVTGNTNQQGGGAAHENRPPYIALLTCIKI